MENFCQRIRERAEIIGINLSISQQQTYNKYVNLRIEDGVHVNDALDSVYLLMKNDFICNKNSQLNNIVEKQDIVEKSNINYFIEKFDNKLELLRKYHDNLKAHYNQELSDDQNILFRAKEAIYIDILSGLKIIKSNIENYLK